MSQIPWYQRQPETIGLEEANEILQDTENRECFPNQFSSLLSSVRDQVNTFKEQSKTANPLAWFQPSYEQCLKLNAWIYGIDYIIDFDANRIGKTAGGVVNALLWIVPQQEDWVMFKKTTDHKGRTYQVIPRPPISALKGLRANLKSLNLQGNPKLPFDHPSNLECYKATMKWLHENKLNIKPPSHDRVIWVGGPDKKWNEDNVMKEWMKWVPKDLDINFTAYTATLTIKYPTPSNRAHPNAKITIQFKSYDQEDTKWSGTAVDGIMLSEGVPTHIFNEVKMRYKYPAFGSWDYTPYEPRNTAGKSLLAHRVFTGEEKLPLNPYVYSGFGIEDCPEFIMDADKRRELIDAWEGKPEADARIKGVFFVSSPIVLQNYNPKFHCLHITFEELRKLYAPKPLLLFRGIDPGWGHLTACTWMALAPDNTRYIYKVYAEARRTISQRCEDIINLSGNKRIQHPKSPRMWMEYVEKPENQIRNTWIDYHTFKTDETTGQAFARNYIINGLPVRPSLTTGPKERASLFDDLLKPQLHLPHPITKSTPGSQLFFLCREEGVAAALRKMSNLFWGTYEKGEKRGLTKDEIQDFDDDELDSACYVALPPLTYHSFFSVEKQNNSGQIVPQRLSFNQVDFVT